MGLKDKAVIGVVWTSIGSVGAGFLNFILTMILARILTPADFGLLELLVIFTALSEAFIDSGFSQAVIRDQEATQTDLSSVFIFNVTIAITIYAILYFSAPLIARFYHESQLIWLSRFVFLTVVFHACSIIQNAYFARTLQFRPQAIASIISIIIAGFIAAFMAFYGMGVWALACNLVLFAFLKMIFFWVFSPWRPSFCIAASSIKKYFKFGVNLLIQGLVDKFVTNLESLLIGRVYTKSDLGYFSQARKLDSYFTQTTTGVIQKVTYPILSKLDSDSDNLKQGYSRVLQITMFFMTPMLFFMAAGAENILLCLFGPQWKDSTPYLQLWSVIGLLVCFYSIFINVFLVKNRTTVLLWISMFRQILRVISIILLIKISIMALVYGILLVTIISAFMYAYFGGRLIRYNLCEIFVDIYPTLLSSLAGALFVYLLPLLISINSLYIILFLQLLLMAFTYCIFGLLLKNRAYFEAKDIIISLIKSIVGK